MNQPRTARIIDETAKAIRDVEDPDEPVAEFYAHARAALSAALSDPVYAAAPAMLEALKELYRLRGLNCDLQDEASLRARAAIALATEDSK